jgi:type III pantothenate kinase
VILLLDAGNSRIKWGRWQDGAWRGRGAVPVSEPEALRPILAETAPDWVGVGCVAGDEVRAWLAVLLDAVGVEQHWLRPEAESHGVVNHYDRPETLGADRYAALIACVRNGYAPCVVASAGTAVTVDALAGGGEFLGGMILPGAQLMRRALGTGTASVAALSGTWRRFPRATGDGVETGIWTAISAAVAAMHGRLSSRLGRTVDTVLTGGEAEFLSDRLADTALPGVARVEEYLVLEGLLWVARDLGVPGA